MGLKKLKPTLPKDEAQIWKDGFRGNISGAEKFITDGHVLILRDKFIVNQGGVKMCPGEKSVALGSMQKCWDDIVERNQMTGEFIGCASIKSALDDSDPVIIAAVRRIGGGCTALNPWKLAFVLLTTGADALLVDARSGWRTEPIVAVREDVPVAIIMPMSYTERDIKAYDLEGEAVGLNGGTNAVPKNK